METIESEILVVGGGGAGMSAAAAASARGADVVIVDDNPFYGGQIWRRGIESKAPAEASELIRRLDSNDVRFVAGTTIYDARPEGVIYGSAQGGNSRFLFDKLIIATGARERYLPFPGWTLPNVYGAGGLQALVKGGFSIEGKRIIVAGSGPLLLAVADYLHEKGGEVLFVAEQASAYELAKFAASMAFFPSKLRQALSFRIKSGAFKIQTGSFVEKALGNGKLDRVNVRTRRGSVAYDCDLLATGFHLVPNLELPQLLGCETTEHGVEVDEFQRTSVGDIYAVGETTGIGGIELSCIEGEIAGIAATGDTEVAKSLFKKRKKYSRFASMLNRTFRIRPELRDVVLEDTLVCRCEDITYDALKKFGSFRDAKLQTRCGMGPCQGRICGGAVEYLFGWENVSVRPPIFPVELGDLGNYEL